MEGSLFGPEWPPGAFSAGGWRRPWAWPARPLQRRMCNFLAQTTRQNDLRIPVGEKCVMARVIERLTGFMPVKPEAG